MSALAFPIAALASALAVTVVEPGGRFPTIATLGVASLAAGSIVVAGIGGVVVASFGGGELALFMVVSGVVIALGFGASRHNVTWCKRV